MPRNQVQPDGIIVIEDDPGSLCISLFKIAGPQHECFPLNKNDVVGFNFLQFPETLEKSFDDKTQFPEIMLFPVKIPVIFLFQQVGISAIHALLPQKIKILFKAETLTRYPVRRVQTNDQYFHKLYCTERNLIFLELKNPTTDKTDKIHTDFTV